MRSLSFDPQILRKHLLRHKIATLPELKEALGTNAGLTVFRKLKLLDYLSSYTHRGRYYALRESARFDDAGLWSHEAVWFSRHGTLVATIESFVHQAPHGWFADELADALHAEVQDPLHDLVRGGRLRRTEVAGRFLYTAADSRQSRDQIRARQTASAVPLVADTSALQVSPEELKAAILLFYSLLDEQQRRLFAGLESIKLGHGGDSTLAAFLGLDPHTVARGRQQLLDQNVTSGRRSKKNRRHRHTDRVFARIRHRRRSHHRAEVVPTHYGEDCHGAGRLRDHHQPQDRRPSSPSDGLFPSGQSQETLYRPQSRSQ
jgi:hypothetical protein